MNRFLVGTVLFAMFGFSNSAFADDCHLKIVRSLSLSTDGAILTVTAKVEIGGDCGGPCILSGTFNIVRKGKVVQTDPIPQVQVQDGQGGSVEIVLQDLENLDEGDKIEITWTLTCGTIETGFFVVSKTDKFTVHKEK
jgi:hypothetical protein